MALAARSPNGTRVRDAFGRWRTSRRFVAWSMVVPLVAGLVVFTVYPFIYLALLSFSDSNLGSPFRGWVGFEHYGEAFGEPRFTTSLGRSAAYALLTTVVSMLLGFAVALVVSRRRVVRPGVTPSSVAKVAGLVVLIAVGGVLVSRSADLLDVDDFSASSIDSDRRRFSRST